MIYSILFWFILIIPTNSQRSDCVSVCSHIEDDRAYGKCISDCGKSPRKDNVPEPVCESLEYFGNIKHSEHYQVFLELHILKVPGEVSSSRLPYWMETLPKYLVNHVLETYRFFPDYPQPPANVSVQTKVVIDNGKILETTVAWTAQPGT